MSEDEKKALAHSVAIQTLALVGWRTVAHVAGEGGGPVPTMDEIDEIRALVSKAKVEL